MTLDLDPARLFVLVDLDAALSRVDVRRHLLERAGRAGWEAAEDLFDRGGSTSRERLSDGWSFLPHDEERLRSIAREVPVDPAAGPLVRDLREAGAEVLVVSDGYGFSVREALAAVGAADVEVLTNAVDFDAGELRFPHEDRCCPCTSCGVCKQAPLREARARGRVTVLVGASLADRKAALLADVVVTRGPMAAWCDAFGVPWVPFETLDDVGRLLLPARRPGGPLVR